MNPNLIFYPVCALVFFTGLVGLRLFVARQHAIRTKRVRPNTLQDAKVWDETFCEAEDFSDALVNLFEVPVLFYTLALTVFVTHHSDIFYILGAWAFVFLRVVQGVVHCTSNQIRVRAASYLVGSIVLFAMWIRFAVQISVGH